MNHLLALSDSDGNVRYFEPGDLGAQLVHTEFASGSGAIRSAAKNLAFKVAEMRRLQKLYFSNSKMADESTRLRLLEQSKKAENQVDALIPIYLQTVEKL